MKKTLVSLVLGIAVTVNSTLLPSKAYCLEEKAKVQAEEKTPSGFPIKDEYTFDEFKQSLGKRYESLSKEQKKLLEKRWKDNEYKHNSCYHNLIPAIYGYPEFVFKEQYEGDKKSFLDFSIKKIDKTRLRGYLDAFPWIKESELEKIDKIPYGQGNPDKILLWLEEMAPHFNTSFHSMKNKRE